MALKRTREGGASSTLDSLTAATHTKTPEPAPFPQIDPHSNRPEFSPTPNSPPTSTHTATTTSESGYSKVSAGVGPSPLQQVPGTFPSLNHSNPCSSESHQRQHSDENPDVLATSAFLEHDEAHAVLKLLPPPEENRGPTSDMEADRYDTPRDILAQIEPSHTMTIPFTAHGLLSDSLQDRQERSAKLPEEVVKEEGDSLVNVPTKPLPPQTGLPGAVSGQEGGRKHEGYFGAVVTERERERGLAGERQRRFNDSQKQQLEMIQEVAQAYERPISEFPVPSPPSRFQGAVHVQRREASSSSVSLIAATNTETPELVSLPQIDQLLNSPEFSPTPAMLDSPPTLTHTLIAAGESGYSKYPSGVGPSPPQHPGSYSKYHQRQRDDENSVALETLTFLDDDEAHAVSKPPPPPPPQEGRSLTSDMEADGYDEPSDSGDDASQDNDSHEGQLKSSFASPRQGLAKPQAQQDGWTESSSLEPIDPATTSVSEKGTHSTPPFSSCVGADPPDYSFSISTPSLRTFDHTRVRSA
jgi:hypothetical protein